MDYTEFDKALLEAIRGGVCTFGGLSNRLRGLAAPFASAPDEGWRVVDRRLQALRKKGAVTVARRGRDHVWSVA